MNYLFTNEEKKDKTSKLSKFISEKEIQAKEKNYEQNEFARFNQKVLPGRDNGNTENHENMMLLLKSEIENLKKTNSILEQENKGKSILLNEKNFEYQKMMEKLNQNIKDSNQTNSSLTKVISEYKKEIEESNKNKLIYENERIQLNELRNTNEEFKMQFQEYKNCIEEHKKQNQKIVSENLTLKKFEML